MAETQGLRNMFEDAEDNIRRQTGYVKAIYSARGERDTISSTRHDTASKKISAIYMLTSGCISSLTCPNIVNSSDISSGTTIGAGVKIFVKDATKIKTSSHGAQMIYLNE